MRSSTSTWHSRVATQLLGYSTPDMSDASTQQAWRTRALHESAIVRRALRAAGTDRAVTTPASTMDALERGMVAELLVTRRYVDMNQDAYDRALRLGRAGRAHVRILSGTAALMLDLAAGGMGAMLRRSPSPRAIDAQMA